MEVITHWAGNIVSYLVFLTVLTGLLPAHKYEKYIRLFAGCILLLIVLKPLTDGAASGGAAELSVYISFV